MNALVKKEIRLLLPSWLMAMLLAVPSICTRMDDGIPVALLFFGLAMLGLTSLGRESSLNTFSQLLAQPAERLRIWKIKLSVLAVAFLAVTVVWRLAVALSFKDYGSGGAPSREDVEAVTIAGCMAIVVTFTGGLWAALLLRQVAGAFWLMVLVPATLAGFTTAFVSVSQPNSGVISALCIIIGLYSVGGFLYARWLFFRAQDVGWTGGIITLPELKIFSVRSVNAEEIRQRRPIAALIKKEIQLQQVSLLGAAVLLVLHTGIIILRTCHKFPRESAGEILTIIFWMLWLVLPVIVSGMAIAEERRLGVLEGQLTLPASRRVQFAIKCMVAMFLGIFLGGVMPCLLEAVSANTGMFHSDLNDWPFIIANITGLSAWLSLAGFFASSMAKNFLQAVGFAIATFMFSSLVFPAFTSGRMIFFDTIPVHSFLPLIVAVPALSMTLLWLAYLNYKNFREGWLLWRRSLLVFIGAIFFVIFTSTAVYNRAWEYFEPAEPDHGPAQLTLGNPPALVVNEYNLLVRLPDGRVWFDYLAGDFGDDYGNRPSWKLFTHLLLKPLPYSYGPQRFVGGSNWVAATTGRVYFGSYSPVPGKRVHSWGYLDTVGIKPDGTLWVSDRSEQDKWTADTLHQFGSETNWSQLAQAKTSVVLLKKDGTLWRWGSTTNAWETDWAHKWPGLPSFKPYPIDNRSDWQELVTFGGGCARRADGSFWRVTVNWKNGKDLLTRETNFDDVISPAADGASYYHTAFVRPDGTLWVLNRYWDEKTRQLAGTGVLQVGKENDWRAVAAPRGNMMVALKSDGSLWVWHGTEYSFGKLAGVRPTRLGIHSDWVGLASMRGFVIALAADGGLWLWPDRMNHDNEILIRLPKQPQFLGNVLRQPD